MEHEDCVHCKYTRPPPIYVLGSRVFDRYKLFLCRVEVINRRGEVITSFKYFI